MKIGEMYEGKFKVYAALHEESKEGWVWISPLNGIENKKWRVIKIIRPDNKKKIVVEKRVIDENFVNIYNEREHTKSDLDKEKDTKSIVMNYNYRTLLGVSTGETVNLKIKKANMWDKLWVASSQHPNIFVKYSIRLGLISVALGAISMIISLIKLK